MTLAFLLKNLLGTLLLPPANGLALLLLAFLLRKRRGALAMALLGGALLFVQSLPIAARALIASLEAQAGPVFSNAEGAGAVVILGSGVNIDAEEYGGDTASERSLTRLRYGVHVARQTGLPILVTGGKLPRTSRSEAEIMAGIAESEFGIAVRWQEDQSMDTADNARLSAAMLKAEGIERIVLVTHAFHMPRARQLFAAEGLSVVAAPTDFKGRNRQPLTVFDFLPQPRAMQNSYYALHEYIGIAWASLPRP